MSIENSGNLRELIWIGFFNLFQVVLVLTNGSDALFDSFVLVLEDLQLLLLIEFLLLLLLDSDFLLIRSVLMSLLCHEVLLQEN